MRNPTNKELKRWLYLSTLDRKDYLKKYKEVLSKIKEK